MVDDSNCSPVSFNELHVYTNKYKLLTQASQQGEWTHVDALPINTSL